MGRRGEDDMGRDIEQRVLALRARLFQSGGQLVEAGTPGLHQGAKAEVEKVTWHTVQRGKGMAPKAKRVRPPTLRKQASLTHFGAGKRTDYRTLVASMHIARDKQLLEIGDWMKKRMETENKRRTKKRGSLNFALDQLERRVEWDLEHEESKNKTTTTTTTSSSTTTTSPAALNQVGLTDVIAADNKIRQSRLLRMAAKNGIHKGNRVRRPATRLKAVRGLNSYDRAHGRFGRASRHNDEIKATRSFRLRAKASKTRKKRKSAHKVSGATAAPAVSSAERRHEARRHRTAIRAAVPVAMRTLAMPLHKHTEAAVAIARQELNFPEISKDLRQSSDTEDSDTEDSDASDGDAEQRGDDTTAADEEESVTNDSSSSRRRLEELLRQRRAAADAMRPHTAAAAGATVRPRPGHSRRPGTSHGGMSSSSSSSSSSSVLQDKQPRLEPKPQRPQTGYRMRAKVMSARPRTAPTSATAEMGREAGRGPIRSRREQLRREDTLGRVLRHHAEIQAVTEVQVNTAGTTGLGKLVRTTTGSRSRSIPGRRQQRAHGKARGQTLGLIGLEHVLLVDSHVTDAKAEKVLPQALTMDTQSLELRGNSLRLPAGLRGITLLVRHSTQLTHLDLSRNQLSDEAVVSLAHAMGRSRSLLALNLSDNRFSDEGETALGNMLQQNSTLMSLELAWNRIGGSGAAKLLDGLCANSSVVHVDLSWNNICTLSARRGHRGGPGHGFGQPNLGGGYHGTADPTVAMDALVRCIRQTWMLRWLDIRHNNQNEAELSAVAHALNDNCSLVVAYVSQPISVGAEPGSAARDLVVKKCGKLGMHVHSREYAATCMHLPDLGLLADSTHSGRALVRRRRRMLMGHASTSAGTGRSNVPRRLRHGRSARKLNVSGMSTTTTAAGAAAAAAAGAKAKGKSAMVVGFNPSEVEERHHSSACFVRHLDAMSWGPTGGLSGLGGEVPVAADASAVPTRRSTNPFFPLIALMPSTSQPRSQKRSIYSRNLAGSGGTGKGKGKGKGGSESDGPKAKMHPLAVNNPWSQTGLRDCWLRRRWPMQTFSWRHRYSGRYHDQHAWRGFAPFEPFSLVAADKYAPSGGGGAATRARSPPSPSPAAGEAAGEGQENAREPEEPEGSPPLEVWLHLSFDHDDDRWAARKMVRVDAGQYLRSSNRRRGRRTSDAEDHDGVDGKTAEPATWELTLAVPPSNVRYYFSAVYEVKSQFDTVAKRAKRRQTAESERTNSLPNYQRRTLSSHNKQHDEVARTESMKHVKNGRIDYHSLVAAGCSLVDLRPDLLEVVTDAAHDQIVESRLNIALAVTNTDGTEEMDDARAIVEDVRECELGEVRAGRILCTPLSRDWAAKNKRQLSHRHLTRGNGQHRPSTTGGGRRGSAPTHSSPSHGRPSTSSASARPQKRYSGVGPPGLLGNVKVTAVPRSDAAGPKGEREITSIRHYGAVFQGQVAKIPPRVNILRNGHYRRTSSLRKNGSDKLDKDEDAEESRFIFSDDESMTSSDDDIDNDAMAKAAMAADDINVSAAAVVAMLGAPPVVRGSNMNEDDEGNPAANILAVAVAQTTSSMSPAALEAMPLTPSELASSFALLGNKRRRRNAATTAMRRQLGYWLDTFPCNVSSRRAFLRVHFSGLVPDAADLHAIAQDGDVTSQFPRSLLLACAARPLPADARRHMESLVACSGLMRPGGPWLLGRAPEYIMDGAPKVEEHSNSGTILSLDGPHRILQSSVQVEILALLRQHAPPLLDIFQYYTTVSAASFPPPRGEESVVDRSAWAQALAGVGVGMSSDGAYALLTDAGFDEDEVEMLLSAFPDTVTFGLPHVEAFIPGMTQQLGLDNAKIPRKVELARERMLVLRDAWPMFLVDVALRRLSPEFDQFQMAHAAMTGTRASRRATAARAKAHKAKAKARKARARARARAQQGLPPAASGNSVDGDGEATDEDDDELTPLAESLRIVLERHILPHCSRIHGFETTRAILGPVTPKGLPKCGRAEADDQETTGQQAGGGNKDDAVDKDGEDEDDDELKAVLDKGEPSLMWWKPWTAAAGRGTVATLAEHDGTLVRLFELAVKLGPDADPRQHGGHKKKGETQRRGGGRHPRTRGRGNSSTSARQVKVDVQMPWASIPHAHAAGHGHGGTQAKRTRRHAESHLHSETSLHEAPAVCVGGWMALLEVLGTVDLNVPQALLAKSSSMSRSSRHHHGTSGHAHMPKQGVTRSIRGKTKHAAAARASKAAQWGLTPTRAQVIFLECCADANGNASASVPHMHPMDAHSQRLSFGRFVVALVKLLALKQHLHFERRCRDASFRERTKAQSPFPTALKTFLLEADSTLAGPRPEPPSVETKAGKAAGRRMRKKATEKKRPPSQIDKMASDLELLQKLHAEDNAKKQAEQKEKEPPPPPPPPVPSIGVEMADKEVQRMRGVLAVVRKAGMQALVETAQRRVNEMEERIVAGTDGCPVAFVDVPTTKAAKYGRCMTTVLPS